MKIDQVQLGEIIRQIRKGKGLSLREVAGRVGVTENYLCLLEKGKRGASVETINAVAEVLGIPAVLITFLCTEPRRNRSFNHLVRTTQASIRAAIRAQVALQEAEAVNTT